MVNRCKNPEIPAVARSELNSWVGYLVNFISNRFLRYKTQSFETEQEQKTMVNCGIKMGG